MAEKFFSGRDGKLFLDRSADSADTGLVEQLKVRDWSLQTNLSLLEITTLGDNHRTTFQVLLATREMRHFYITKVAITKCKLVIGCTIQE